VERRKNYNKKKTEQFFKKLGGEGEKTVFFKGMCILELRARSFFFFFFVRGSSYISLDFANFWWWCCFEFLIPGTCRPIPRSHVPERRSFFRHVL